MATTISVHDRRLVAIALANADVAKELCDAIEAACDAVVAVDCFLYVPVADLEAGDVVDGLPLFLFDDHSVTIQSISLMARGAFVGVDASNTIAITVKDVDGNTIVTKTYDNVVVPTDNAGNALGTLNATHKILRAGERCIVDIVCGDTADPPPLSFLVRYRTVVG